MDKLEAPHGKKPQNLTNEELTRLVRLDLARVLKTVNRYSKHLEAAQDKAAAKVLEHLRDEEKHHVGELLALLQYLDPEEGQNYAEGAAEATKLLMQLGIDATTTGSEAAGALVVTQPAPLVPLCDVPVRPTKQNEAKPQGGKPTKKDGPKKGKGKKAAKDKTSQKEKRGAREKAPKQEKTRDRTKGEGN